MSKKAYDRGGSVSVPQAPEEPDQRIDKMTGLPYDQQAGGAFVDEEDRLQFVAGGLRTIIQRLVRGVDDVVTDTRPVTRLSPDDGAKETLREFRYREPKNFIDPNSPNYSTTRVKVDDEGKFIKYLEEEENLTLNDFNNLSISEKDDLVDIFNLSDPNLKIKDIANYQRRNVEYVTQPDNRYWKARTESETKIAKELDDELNNIPEEDMGLVKKYTDDIPRVSDKPPESATVTKQEFLEGSTEKSPQYNGSFFSETRYDNPLSSAVPRELGFHVGTKGQAENIMMRGTHPNAETIIEEAAVSYYKAADDLILRDEALDLVGKKGVPDEIYDSLAKELNEIVPIGVEPKLQKGFINVKNPLVLDTDFINWNPSKFLGGSDLTGNLKLAERADDFIKALDDQVNLPEAQFTKIVDDAAGQINSIVRKKDMNSGKLLNSAYDHEINRITKTMLEDLGFDSIKYKNLGELARASEKKAGGNSYILFREDQFKTSFKQADDVDELTNIILKSSRKNVNIKQAQEAANKINNIIEVGYGAEDAITKSKAYALARTNTKVLLDEKGGIDYSNPRKWSEDRGYTPDEINTFEENIRLSYDMGLGDSAGVNAQIYDILDDYQLRDVDYKLVDGKFVAADDVVGDTIKIPSGRNPNSGVTRTVPRYWYHSIRGREFGKRGEILPYSHREFDILLPESFPAKVGRGDRVRDNPWLKTKTPPTKAIYLAQDPSYIPDAIKIDASKLDPDLMRLTGQAEGHAIYAGEIPKSAQAPKASQVADDALDVSKLTEPKYPDASVSELDLDNPYLLTKKEAEALKESLPKGFPRKEVAELQQSIIDLKGGKISPEEHAANVNRLMPIEPIEGVPNLDTYKTIAAALNRSLVQKGLIGLNSNIRHGKRVGSRLDINAYQDNNVWVVALHEVGIKGKAIGYGKTSVLDDVEFTSSPEFFAKVGVGTKTPSGKRTAKGPLARIEGNWNDISPEDARSLALEADASDEWVEVGFNPDRHSFFYDKANGKPLGSAERVVQVGAKVLARKPIYRELRHPAHQIKTTDGGVTYFSSGGKVLGGLKRTRRDEGGLIGRLLASLKKLVGRGPQYARNSHANATELNNRMVDEGVLPESNRVEWVLWKKNPEWKEGDDAKTKYLWGEDERKIIDRKLTVDELRKGGDFGGDDYGLPPTVDEEPYNAINHALLSFDQPAGPHRAILQGREHRGAEKAWLAGRDPRTEHLDRWNNSYGIESNRQGLSLEQFEDKIINDFKEGYPEGGPQVGQNLITNYNDLPESYYPEIHKTPAALLYAKGLLEP